MFTFIMCALLKNVCYTLENKLNNLAAVWIMVGRKVEVSGSPGTRW